MDNSTKRYMSHNIIPVLWTESLQNAFEKMNTHHFRHLPVVSETNEVVGIISDRDFQRAMQVDASDYFSKRVAQAEFDPQAKVRDYMCWPIQTLPVNSTLVDAAKLMLEKKISALLVSNEAEIVGILTTDDMLKALIQTLQQKKEEHPIKDRLLSVFFNSPANELVDLANQAGI